MAKKKKSRKARKQAQQQVQHLPLHQLIQKADVLLASGSYRDAIKMLKIALQKNPADEKTKGLLGRAYALREDQLRRKGMQKEADALHDLVRRHRPDGAQMDAAELLFFLKATTPPNCLSLYRQFLKTNPPNLEAEIFISGASLIAMDWKALSQMPDTALMKPELPTLKSALDLMNAADWEAALVHLNPLSRRSPLAPIKLFCRAMVCFYRSDDPGMKRALAMIPQSSPLAAPANQLAEDSSKIAPLWQGHFIRHNEIQSILGAVKSADPAGTARQFKRIAERVRPDDPRSVIEQLLAMMLPLAWGQELDAEDFADLAEKLLPGRIGEAEGARFDFLEFADGLHDTDDYLAFLEDVFPDSADRDMATSMILSASVKWLVEQGRQYETIDLQHPPAKRRLGITAGEPDCILLEILIKALELDPHNDQAARLFMERPHPSRPATRLKETGLTLLMNKRPEEPAPCLSLARLYLGKNAVRKAEKCIREAGKRAPYDEQVTELHTLTLIKSIDNNFKRNKHHLVKADLEKAESLCSTKLAAFIAARRIVFETEQTGQLSIFGERHKLLAKNQLRTIIEQHIAELPDTEQLRTLGILVDDRRQRPAAWDKSKNNCLAFCFKQRAGMVDALPSKSIRNLLLPVVDDLPILPNRTAWLDIFLKRYKRILNGLNDEDVLPLLEVLVEADRIGMGLNEIRRRLETASDPYVIYLTFYRMVMQAIAGQESVSADAFEGFLAGVAPPHQEVLRTAAKRLHPFARGGLRAALEHFDFKLLEGGCNCPICSGLMDMEMDESDWQENPLFDPLDAGPVDSIIGMMETFIDTNQLRGASPQILKRKRNTIMNNFYDRVMFEGLADLLSPDGVDSLSDEARYLFFGEEV
jgi:hypothetical protein